MNVRHSNLTHSFWNTDRSMFASSRRRKEAQAGRYAQQKETQATLFRTAEMQLRDALRNMQEEQDGF